MYLFPVPELSRPHFDIAAAFWPHRHQDAYSGSNDYTAGHAPRFAPAVALQLSTPHGRPVNIWRQQLCPEGVWGPRLHHKCVKNVRGLRSHTFFTLLLGNLGPRTPPDTTVAQFYYFGICWKHLFRGNLCKSMASHFAPPKAQCRPPNNKP